MWNPVDEPWQYRVLDALPPSVDKAQLETAQSLSPQERVEALVQLMRMVDELKRARQAAAAP